MVQFQKMQTIESIEYLDRLHVPPVCRDVERLHAILIESFQRINRTVNELTKQLANLPISQLSHVVQSSPVTHTQSHKRNVVGLSFISGLHQYNMCNECAGIYMCLPIQP